jgi:hypothetical protein
MVGITLAVILGRGWGQTPCMVGITLAVILGGWAGAVILERGWGQGLRREQPRWAAPQPRPQDNPCDYPGGGRGRTYKMHK